MNAMNFNNVTISKKVRDTMEEGEPRPEPHPLLAKLVEHVAANNPLWTLVGYDCTHNNALLGRKIIGFKVIKDRETLGFIRREYHGRDYQITITNDRISASMLRGNAYHTTSWEKAALKVKKTFIPLSVNERMDKAFSSAQRCVNNQSYEQSRSQSSLEKKINQSAIDYATGEGKEHFMNHLKASSKPESSAALKAMDELAEVNFGMMTIEKVKNHLGLAGTTLVVKDVDTYLVKTVDNVQIYDDNTLPHNLRRGLGMLKLVEAEHFITDVGCRVSDEVFVLLDEEPNNVM